ncbi:MAG: hypothetical protein V4689_22970 [Verrucomicrobiota bacterium]
MPDATRVEDSIEPADIVVDYDHPHGRIVGITLSEILKTPNEGTRKFLTICNPRTSGGHSLNLKYLKRRTKSGGDLEGTRILWSQD